jgi:DNA gyrase/topoisomerase IV subunit A
MNIKSALVLLAVLAAFIVTIGWVRQRATVFDQALQMKTEEIEKLHRQLQLQTREAQPASESSLTQSDRLELMRLRNEVTQLRSSNRALANIISENARLVAENQKPRRGSPNAPGQNAMADSIPREPASQNAEYDPLTFYRKNPELMKRYFPHLFKEGQAQEQNEIQGSPQ